MWRINSSENRSAHEDVGVGASEVRDAPTSRTGFGEMAIGKMKMGMKMPRQTLGSHGGIITTIRELASLPCVPRPLNHAAAGMARQVDYRTTSS